MNGAKNLIVKRMRRLCWLVGGAFILLLVMVSAVIGGTQNNCDNQSSGAFNVISSADQEAVAKSLHDNLKSVSGATEGGIAGYLGNTQNESGFQAGVVQGNNPFEEATAMNGSVSGYALGLNQWDGNRRVKLLNEAKGHSKDWRDPGFQLDFALNHDGADSEILKKGLAIDNVEEATEYLRANWERGGAGTTTQRISYAKNWYSKLSGGSSSNAIDSATTGASQGLQSQSNSSGCSTKSAKGMGSSGAPVKDIPDQYRDKIQDKNFTAVVGDNTYPFGQCTWYVYNRMQELGHPVENYLQNGADWATTAKAKGYETSDKPHEGWAVSFTQGSAGADPIYGHVAVVEAMSDDGQHFLVSECNVVDMGSGTVSFRELTAGDGMVFIKGKG
ncbi:Surface antigen [Fructobacillus tropaeoli]|nr:Surface antigen [Fructobacillus tropaeoli]